MLSSLSEFHKISFFGIKTVHQVIAIFVKLLLLPTSRYGTFLRIPGYQLLSFTGRISLPPEDLSHSWIMIIIHLPLPIKYD
jgi:hypothetical protein